DHAGDLVQLRLEARRLADAQAVHVEDPVAVVGGAAIAPDRLAAVAHQRARDVAARHRYHLDRQGEAPEDLDDLGGIDDADEAARGGGDDLLARERATAALDQAPARIALVRTVDVERDLAGRIEVEHRDAAFPQQARGLLGTGNGALDVVAALGQRIDEMRDGGTGADTDDHARFD